MVKAKARMVERIAWQRLEIGAPGQHVAADMAIDEAGKEPDEQRADENPAEEEVHDAPGGQVTERGNRDLRGEGNETGLRVGSAHPQHAGCVEGLAENRGLSARPLRRIDRPDAQNRIVELEARLLPYIKRRMGVENLQPRQQQEKQADHPDPMGQAGKDRLAIDQRPALWPGLFNLCHSIPRLSVKVTICRKATLPHRANGHHHDNFISSTSCCRCPWRHRPSHRARYACHDTPVRQPWPRREN